MGGEPLGHWQTGTYQQIAFGRGSSGFIVINNEDGDWATTFSTGLQDGTYCDVYAGPKVASGCAGKTYTVSGGSFNATVTGRNAIALHTQALAAGRSAAPAKRHHSSNGVRSFKGMHHYFFQRF